MGRIGSSCKLKILSLFELWIPPSNVMKRYYEFEFMHALFTEISRSHKLQNTLMRHIYHLALLVPNLHNLIQPDSISISLLHACATSGFNMFPSAICPTDQNLSHLVHQVNSSKSHQLPQCSNNFTGQGELAPTLIPSPF